MPTEKKKSKHPFNRWRIHGALIGGVVLSLLLVFLVGLVGFVNRLEASQQTVPAQVEAIVALTGGPDRIKTGIDLLNQQKQGMRLLISGVNPDVTLENLRTMEGLDSPLFDCCIDIGWEARDTIGNAAETAAWVEKNGYKTILVVTSAYHLPRATKELQHTMPATILHGYPVFQDNVHLENWYLYPGSTRLLIAEYTKYLLTLLRMRWVDETPNI